MRSVAVAFSYPDTIVKSLMAAGVKPFDEGGYYKDLNAARFHARELADEHNMPIQYTWFGSLFVEYPEKLRKMGY